MALTINLEENECITLTSTDIEGDPPDALAFTVDGRVAMTEALLAEFEGATLNPVRVTVSVPDAEPVPVDVTGPPTLRLENVDVGIATPDEDVITDGVESLQSATDDEPNSVGAPNVIAFTAEGTIRDVPTTTFEAITDADRTPELESITFAVEGTRLSDGGTEDDDVVFELSLLGYGIVVRRDGTIVVGSDEGLASIDLS